VFSLIRSLRARGKLGRGLGTYSSFPAANFDAAAAAERAWIQDKLSLPSFWDPEIDKRMYPLF